MGGFINHRKQSISKEEIEKEAKNRFPVSDNDKQIKKIVKESRRDDFIQACEWLLSKLNKQPEK